MAKRSVGAAVSGTSQMISASHVSASHQGNQLDRLLRGQVRLESRLDELRSSLDRGLDSLRVALMATSRHIPSTSGIAVDMDGDFSITHVATPPQPSHMPTAPLTPLESNMNVGGESTGPDNYVERHHRLTPLDVYKNIAADLKETDFEPTRAALAQHKRCRANTATGGLSVAASSFSSMGGRGANFRLPLHPMSMPRMTIDGITVPVLMLDAIFVPFFLAFDVPLEGFALFIGWLGASFWTIDLILNFCTGILVNDELISSFAVIAKRYLQRGFLLDASVLSIDYIELLGITGRGTGGIQVLRLLRFAKLTRLVRLVVRLRSGLLTRLDAVLTYYLQLYALIGYIHRLSFAFVLLKLLLLIVWLSHVGCCIWYYWEERVFSENDEYWLADIEDISDTRTSKYFFGMYWSVSLMFAGSSYIPPANTGEAVLGTVLVSVSALFVTAVTSILAAILIESHEAQREMKKEERTLNRFMEQRRVPPLVAIAIRRNFLAGMAIPVRLTEFDIPHLHSVTRSLRAHLRHAQYEHVFMKMHFCRILDVLDDHAVQELCFTAASIVLTQAGDELFRIGDVMSSSIFVDSGDVSYTSTGAVAARWKSDGVGNTHSLGTTGMRSRRSSVDLIPTRVNSSESPFGSFEVHEERTLVKSWICELALFLNWRTVGNLKTTEHSEIVYVSAEIFAQVVTKSPVIAAIAASYSANLAALYVVDNKPLQQRPIPTDVDSMVDYDWVVAQSHNSVREVISIALVSKVLKRSQGTVLGFLTRSRQSALSNEVEAGKSFLMMNTDGDICRIIQVAVLRLLDEEDHVCIQLADNSNGICKPQYRLPGKKVEGNEQPDETIQRLLLEDFASLMPYIELSNMEVVIVEKKSDSFAGLPTKYIRFVQNAVFRARMEFDPNTPSAADGVASASMNLGTASTSTPGRWAGPMTMRGARTNSRTTGTPSTMVSIPTALRPEAAFVLEVNCSGVIPDLRTYTSGQSLGSEAAQVAAMPHMKFGIYKWVSLEQHEVFEYGGADPQQWVAHWVSGLTAHRLRRLRSWTLVGGGSQRGVPVVHEGSEVEEGGQEEEEEEEVKDVDTMQEIRWASSSASVKPLEVFEV